MNLNVNITFRSPPRFGGEAPQLEPKNFDSSKIPSAVETAIISAIEAGFFTAGGRLTITIRAEQRV